MIGGSAARPYFEHAGGNEGYRCLLRVYETGDGAVVMTNGDNGGELMGELMRTVAEEYAWPDRPPVRDIAKLDPRSFDAFAGTYQMPHGTFTFTREGERLLSQATGQGQVEIFPESERVYFAKRLDAVITFQVDEQGRASSVVLRQGEQDFAGKRLDYFVTGWGTGGTLTGAGQMIRLARPEVEIIATEPAGAALLSGKPFTPHKIQGWTPDFVPAVLDRTVPHRILPVTDAEAIEAARALASREGIFCGISSGGTFAAARKVADEAPAGSVILAMLPDTGERYLSTALFDGIPEGSDPEP